jgi:hypothetical protein
LSSVTARQKVLEWSFIYPHGSSMAGKFIVLFRKVRKGAKGAKGLVGPASLFWMVIAIE